MVCKRLVDGQDSFSAAQICLIRVAGRNRILFNDRIAIYIGVVYKEQTVRGIVWVKRQPQQTLFVSRAHLSCYGKEETRFDRSICIQDSDCSAFFNNK